MDIFQAMKQRHSVRQYTLEPLSKADITVLHQEIEHCNRESGLHIQLVVNEPRAFDSFLAHYGSFGGRKRQPPRGSMRLLRAAARAESSAAWPEHLLGRPDIQKNSWCI